jgi:BMFP domain-containing protein YqiC
MQTRNPLFDDLAKAASGAMSALGGVRDEMEGRIRDQIARVLERMQVPSRDEFDAIRTMAVRAREENEALKTKLTELEIRLAAVEPGGDRG